MITKREYPRTIKDRTGLEKNTVVGTNPLVANYTFEGNANDVSGNGDHGTVNGATLTTNRFGQANKAYSFDGTNDYIQLPIKTSDYSNTYSISVWINGDEGSIVGEANSTNNSYGCMMFINATKEYLRLGHFKNTVHDFDELTINISEYPILNKWSHIVFVRVNNAYHKAYINGRFAGQVSCADVSAASSNNMRIGADYYSSSIRYFNGKIDDIKIYERELTVKEIKDLYFEGINTDLLLYSYGDEMSGTTGGWVNGYTAGNGGTVTKNTNNITISVNGDNTGYSELVSVITTNNIDLSLYSTLIIEWEYTGTTPNGRVAITHTPSSASNGTTIKISGAGGTSFTKTKETVDISSFTANEKIQVYVADIDNVSTLKIYEIKLIT